MIIVSNQEFTTYENDIRALLQSFFPGEKILKKEGGTVYDADVCLIDIDFICGKCERSADRFLDKSHVKRALYLHLSGMTGRKLPWGTLTGIRPVRIVEMMLAKGMDLIRAREEIRELFLVSEEKLDLMFSIYEKEQKVLGSLDLCFSGNVPAEGMQEKGLPAKESAGEKGQKENQTEKGAKAPAYKNGFSIYIGIPFCPTRCLYCSFTSNPIDRFEQRIDEYLAALRKELLQIREMMGAELQTIYVGGGTPTALSAAELDRLLTMTEDIFGYEEILFTEGERSGLMKGGAGSESLENEAERKSAGIRRVRAAELTVEAGRPDSITKEKLEVLKKHGVDRISINPQTMHQKTLDLIGRRHTVEETVEAYELARSMGFDNINMDLIMGLPGEDLKDVKETLKKIEELKPDSLTVHALAVKRSSRLSTEGKAWGGVERKGLDSKGMDEVSEMTALGAKTAEKLGLEPYYLYRQKNMAGNQDNVGYASPGKECAYNILMMEEKHTVIGVGAGSSTKLVSYENPAGGRNAAEEAAGLSVMKEDSRAAEGKAAKTVRRFENVKNLEDYLGRIDELLKEKEAFFLHD